MPLQINTVISRYNYDHLEQMAKLVAELKAVMWYIFYSFRPAVDKWAIALARRNMNKCSVGCMS